MREREAMTDMKKIEELRLEELREEGKKLSEEEMKQVTGGAGAMAKSGTQNRNRGKVDFDPVVTTLSR